MKKIHTVLGDILPEEIGVTLPHEHICCFSEYLQKTLPRHHLHGGSFPP